MDPKARMPDPEATWKTLYGVAAACALLIVLVAVGDVVTMFFEGDVAAPGSRAAGDWLVQLHDHRLLAMRNLGLLNIVNLVLELPIFLALWHAHRRVDPAFATLATSLLVIGAAVYVARNTVFSMDALAVQYAAAGSEAQRASIAAAGQALAALGEDLTPGMLMGFVLTELAGLVMALVMLFGRVFGRWTAAVGVAGFGALLVFNLLAALVPSAYGAALGLGALGGLLMIAWYVLVARSFAQLARGGRAVARPLAATGAP